MLLQQLYSNKINRNEKWVQKKSLLIFQFNRNKRKTISKVTTEYLKDIIDYVSMECNKCYIMSK